jgi:dissimilatory sulfite reductase (desulfoviridin) alpha/beta subunit
VLNLKRLSVKQRFNGAGKDGLAVNKPTNENRMKETHMNISAEQRKQLKGQGFLSNKDQLHFSARIITENGVLNARQLRNLSEAAEKFGNGSISFTSRLAVELPGISYEDIPAFQAYIARENMVTGGTGAKVRPIVACKGTVCMFGNIDTQALATEIHKRFYEGFGQVILPHKFKIAVGGCPNNCVKPDLNDVGIIGQMVPRCDLDLCQGCDKCAVVLACPMQACGIKEGVLEIDREVCNNCGLCIDKCPFNVVPDGTAGYKITLGGRWGKQVRIGTPLDGIFTKNETMDIIEKTILLFKDKGLPGERLSTMIERFGVTVTEQMLIAHDLLNRKSEILGLNTGKDSER